MTKKTYTIGTIGRGGSPINRAGGALFESIDSGEFSSKLAARKAASELAKAWANDSDDGRCEVAIAVRNDDDSIPDLMTIAMANRARKSVRWL